MKTKHIKDRKVGDKFYRLIDTSDVFNKGRYELQEGTFTKIDLKKKQTTVDYGDEILTINEKDINIKDDPLKLNIQCILRVEELSSGLWKMRYDLNDDTKVLSMQPFNPKK